MVAIVESKAIHRKSREAVADSIRFKPLTGAIGAEVEGIDLNAPLSESAADTIYQGLLDYLVLFFRDQDLQPEAHLALAESIGRVMPCHPFYPSVDGFGPIAVIEDSQTSPPENEIWHSDMSPMGVPPFGSVLHAVELPPIGGDTLWCSMYAVYDALSPELKARIKDIFAVHDLHVGYASNLGNGKSDTRRDVLSEWGSNQGYQKHHPVVLEHPGSGRPLIYANASYTSHLHGIDATESQAILATIYTLIQQPRFQVRLHWTPGTIALWDNLSTQHLAIGDHFPMRRVMHRVTIAENRRAPYRPID